MTRGGQVAKQHAIQDDEDPRVDTDAERDRDDRGRANPGVRLSERTA